MTANITRYFAYRYSATAFTASDDFILAPKLINLARDKVVEVEEFKLYDKYYI